VSRPAFKVALFTGNYNYTRDGSNQALNRLVGYLQDVARAEVRIYSPTTDHPAFDPVGELISIPSISVPGRPEYRLALGLNHAARQNIIRFAPDIVHLSTPDVLGVQAQKLARQIGAPVVASLHTRFETYLDYYGVGWLEPLLKRHLDSFYRQCDYVLAPSPGMAAELEAIGLQGRVRVWSRGVDRDLFDPRRRDMAWRRANGIADDEVAVLFFGRIVLEKGLGLFADVIDGLRARGEKVRALIVGDGPARAWFAGRLPDAVFTGFLTGADLARAVASADVLMNPSVTEAFGNVTLEALAAGVPAVCADVPAHAALVRPGVTGLLCQPTEAQSYIEAVAALIADPARRESFGAAARASSAAYSWSAALSRVVDTYMEAMHRHEQPAEAPMLESALAAG